MVLVLENNIVCIGHSNATSNQNKQVDTSSELKRLISDQDLTIATDSSSFEETNQNEEDKFFFSHTNEEEKSDNYCVQTTPFGMMSPSSQNDNIVNVLPSNESVKKHNALFGKESSVHPIDVESKKMFDEEKQPELEDEIDCEENKSKRAPVEEESTSNKEEVSTEEKTEERQAPKRRDSFLQFVDPVFKVHEHCSSLRPKKSALKRSTSLPVDKQGEAKKEVSRRASFSTLEIRTYNVTLSDNPGGNASGGAPVGLCWEYDAANIQLHCLETFEELRPSRRNLQQLFLSPYVREWMLVRENGYTIEELKDAAAEADKIRKQRQKTKVVCQYAPITVQQAFRSVSKKTKRIMKSSNSNNSKISA